VYALGGITDGERAAACREAGAAGVAVMGAVMRARDPDAVVASLLPRSWKISHQTAHEILQDREKEGTA
jgi:thiamine monophosphate synthase